MNNLTQTPADNNKTFIMYAFSIVYITVFLYISYQALEENYPDILTSTNYTYTK